MTKIVDIREDDLYSSLVSWEINSDEKSLKDEIKLDFAGIKDYQLSEEVEFKGKKGIVSSKAVFTDKKGYLTRIILNHNLSSFISKAPTKAIHFMSMTKREKDKFDFALNYDYSNLDYIPRIKICDSATFKGGWSSNQIIEQLSREAGFNIFCNCYSYWIRQVIADVGRSYLETILSLVSFFSPTIYISNGTIFILDRPFMNGGEMVISSLKGISQVEEKDDIKNSNHIKVIGGLGRFRKEKFKGYIQPMKIATLKSINRSESRMKFKAVLNGDKEVLNNITGKTNKKTAELIFKTDIPSKFSDEEIIEENWMLDIFGNPHYLISRKITKFNSAVDEITHEQEESYEYEFTGEEFLASRKRRMVATINSYSWLLVYGLGVTSRFFKSDTDRIVEEYFYGDDGQLLQKIKQRYSDVVVQNINGVNYYMELKLADRFYNDSGENWYDLSTKKMVVEEEITTYRQITNNLYEETVTRRYLGSALRREGDGLIINTYTREIFGRVPRVPKQYRRMQIYAETISQKGSSDTASIVIRNPNIIDWEDADIILRKVKRSVLSGSYTIKRSYRLPFVAWFDLGWPIKFSSVDIYGEQLPDKAITGRINRVNIKKDKDGASTIVEVTAGEDS
ncbi:MAG: hypothetical protein DRP55_00025 [Spirochaetes bacterium]|nr:MAG: hypothetical protein DRP55_00025 [Spirochaetota bacterium]